MQTAAYPFESILSKSASGVIIPNVPGLAIDIETVLNIAMHSDSVRMLLRWTCKEFCRSILPPKPSNNLIKDAITTNNIGVFEILAKATWMSPPFIKGRTQLIHPLALGKQGSYYPADLFAAHASVDEMRRIREFAIISDRFVIIALTSGRPDAREFIVGVLSSDIHVMQPSKQSQNAIVACAIRFGDPDVLDAIVLNSHYCISIGWSAGQGEVNLDRHAFNRISAQDNGKLLDWLFAHGMEYHQIMRRIATEHNAQNVLKVMDDYGFRR